VFWAEQAAEHGQAAAASWSDRPVMELEVREIVRWLDDGDRVLDVGCANGYSTVQFAAEKAIDIHGVDYIPAMIEQANARLGQLGGRLAGKVSFAEGDALNLAEPTNGFDKVVVIRVIINLGDWEIQLRGLREAVRVLRPGGVLLLSEATVGGWTKLNELRQEWHLPPIPMPPFNNYLDEGRVTEALIADCDLVEISNFASTYFVGTRLIKPLLARLADGEVDVASPESEWNRWIASMPAWGDYGTQKLFVFRKHA
jgi:SAM-dependent methyltransferase